MQEKTNQPAPNGAAAIGFPWDSMLFSYVFFPFFCSKKKWMLSRWPPNLGNKSRRDSGDAPAWPFPSRDVPVSNVFTSRKCIAANRSPDRHRSTGHRSTAWDLNHPVGLVIEPSTVGMSWMDSMGFFSWLFHLWRLESFDPLGWKQELKNPGKAILFLRPKPLNGLISLMFHDISWYAFLFSLEDTKNLQVASGNHPQQVFVDVL